VYHSYGGLEYGAVSTVLHRQGVALTGTPYHFTLQGIDGHEYEFSYTFHELEPNETSSGEYYELDRYYYLMDGERIEDTAWRDPVISATLLKQITGIEYI
jgi:hypothetical protein